LARFLSPAWLAEMSEAAAGAEVPDGAELTIQQVVTDTPEGDVAYVVRLAGGRLALEPGRDPAAAVTITEDWATAAALARGDLSPQGAFMAGRIRVGGDVGALVGVGEALGALTDLFASVRYGTTF